MKRTFLKKISLLTCVVVGFSACTSSDDRVLTQFYREAGALNDDGSFGSATMNNTNVMTNPQQYRLDMAKRFAGEVNSMVNFEFNSAQLDGASRATLARQADWIRQFPEVRFRVYGHTDAVGSNAYNQRLGLRRANAVVSYLSSLGISRARLEAVASFGETRPLIATENPERRNRRTVTEVSGFVGTDPSVLDGKYAQIIYRDYIASAVPPSQLSGITGADLRSGQ